MSYTAHVPSPRVFRLWSAIHAVGACVERRVWTRFGLNYLYPNLFVLLVGPPGVGKTQAISPIEPLIRKSQAVILAPNDISKQSLLDRLAEAGRGAVIDGKPFEYHYLTLSIREMSSFMSKYDLDLAGLLTDLFDCPETQEEEKRTHSKGKMIMFPGISFIIGSSTQNLGNTISNEMWGSGFMARVIIVYADKPVRIRNVFDQPTENTEAKERLLVGLSSLANLKGAMTWEPNAMDFINAFQFEDQEDGPVHNRLAHYNTRRWFHLAKLAMIAAISELSLTVTLDHMNRAFVWLKEVEAVMPEVFKDMVSHEDGAIFEEFRTAMFHIYLRAGAPITANLMYDWLASRVAVHAIQRIIDVAEQADYFRRKAGTSGMDALYYPQPTRKAPGSI